MANIGNTAEISKVRLAEQVADPANPAAGYVYIYEKADGLYIVQSDGTILGPLNGTAAAHAASHQNGGLDEVDVTGLSGLLADAQTPLAHAASHANGQADAIKLDDLATPDDNTDLNASDARHGLLPKLNNTATQFLNGQGAWATPTGVTPAAHAASHANGQADEIDVTGLSGVLADNQKTVRQFIFTIEGTVTVDTGKIRIYNRTGGTLTIMAVHAAVNTAPVGAALIVDIHKNGITIFTNQANRPQIAAGANEAVAAGVDVAAWANGEYLTMDRDQIGVATAGSDLTVTVVTG